MWTEARIKQELDGNFWFFDQEGKLHQRFVDPDWMPSHKKGNPFSAIVKTEPAVKWSDESFDLILEMRGDGMTWPMIADIFQVPVSTLTDYHKRERRIRALKTERERAKSRSQSKIDEVRRMKSEGWDYSRIKRETGYDRRFILKALEEG